MVSVTMSSSGTSCDTFAVWLFPAVLRVGLELVAAVTQKLNGAVVLETASGA